MVNSIRSRESASSQTENRSEPIPDPSSKISTVFPSPPDIWLIWVIIKGQNLEVGPSPLWSQAVDAPINALSALLPIFGEQKLE
jgi:hypothetical protein